MNYFNIQNVVFGGDNMGTSCGDSICGANNGGFWVEYKSLNVSMADEEQYSAYGGGRDGGYGGRSSATAGYIEISGVIAAESACKMEEAQRIVFNNWWLGMNSCKGVYKRLLWDNSCEKENPLEFTSSITEFDGDASTFHAFDTSVGSQSVVLDLGSQKRIGSVYAFFGTYTGQNSGVVEISTDGISWTSYGDLSDNFGVGYGVASGTAGGRYIRITFPANGGDTDISEIEVYDSMYTLPKTYGQNCVVVERPQFEGDYGWAKFTVRLRMENPWIEAGYETMLECVGETMMPTACSYEPTGGCCDDTDAVCGCSGGFRVSIPTCYQGEIEFCAKIKYSGEGYAQNNPGYGGYVNPNPWISRGLVFGANGNNLIFPSDFTMDENDVVTICTKTESIKKNGVELLSTERPTGKMPYLTGGDNYIIIADDTNPMVFGSQICADISFYEVQ